MHARIKSFLIALAFLAAPQSNAGLRSIWSNLLQTPFANLHSITLGGTNQSVGCGTAINSYFEYNLPFSVSTWFNPSPSLTTTEYTIWGNAGNASDFKGAWFEVNAKVMRLVLYPANGSPTFIDVRGTTQLVADGNHWYNLIWSYNGNGSHTGVTLYLNGVADTKSLDNGSVSTTIVGASAFTLGKTDGDPYVPGKIDETAVRNVAVTAPEALAIYNSGTPTSMAGYSGMKAWWRNETTGISPADSTSTIYDRIGSNNCTPSNVISGDFTTDVPNTLPNHNIVLVANGTSTNVDFGTPASLQPTKTTPFSIDYWLYINSVGTDDQSFFGNNPSGGYGGWNMVVNGSATGFTRRMQVELDGTSPNEYFGVEGNAGDYSTGVWQNWGFSYDGTNSPNGLKVYRNGVLLSTSTYGNVASLSGTLNAGFPLTAASQGNGSQWVNGKYYNPTYWSKELSAATFLALYNGGTPINPSTLSDYASFCVSNWQVNRDFVNGAFVLTIKDVKGTNDGTVVNGDYSLTTP